MEPTRRPSTSMHLAFSSGTSAAIRSNCLLSMTAVTVRISFGMKYAVDCDQSVSKYLRMAAGG